MLIGAGIVVGVLVVVVAVLGVIAPTRMDFEREIIVDKPSDFVFADLRFLKNHQRWNPWSKLDKDIVQKYEGEDGTVGATLSWNGNNKVGEGTQEIKSIKDGERIDYELRFKRPMEDTAQSYLITEPIAESKTKVIWGMKSKAPFPGNIFCMVMGMKKVLSGQIDEGLASMKKEIEKGS